MLDSKKSKSLLGSTLIGIAIGSLLLAFASHYPSRGYDMMTLVEPPKTTKDLIDKSQLVFVGEIGSVIQRRTYSGYGPKGELLDGFDSSGNQVPQLPITDFEVKVERVVKDDGTIASGKPVILRVAGDVTLQLKGLAANSDYPVSFTGDRHFFMLTLNPDRATYGFYYGPWSRLLIDGNTLKVSNGSQQVLKLDGNEVPIGLEEFIGRISAN